MASINKVILVGNCGRDAEIRYLPSGQAVANVSIATTSRRKNRVSGDVTEDTQWHRITFYERLAEIAGEYIKKGRAIYVEGRLKYGSYIEKGTGLEKNTVEIVATELQLLGGSEGSGGNREGAASARPKRPSTAAPASSPKPPGAQGSALAGPSGFEGYDDDIPFRSPLSYRGVHLVI